LYERVRAHTGKTQLSQAEKAPGRARCRSHGWLPCLHSALGRSAGHGSADAQPLAGLCCTAWAPGVGAGPRGCWVGLVADLQQRVERAAALFPPGLRQPAASGRTPPAAELACTPAGHWWAPGPQLPFACPLMPSGQHTAHRDHAGRAGTGCGPTRSSLPALLRGCPSWQQRLRQLRTAAGGERPAGGRPRAARAGRARQAKGGLAAASAGAAGLRLASAASAAAASAGASAGADPPVMTAAARLLQGLMFVGLAIAAVHIVPNMGAGRPAASRRPGARGSGRSLPAAPAQARTRLSRRSSC